MVAFFAYGLNVALPKNYHDIYIPVYQFVVSQRSFRVLLIVDLSLICYS